MTTLDNAAERRIRDAFTQWYTTHAFDYAAAPIGSRDCELQWRSWQAATEAAAKKCEAQQSGILNNAIDRTWNRACDYCAAAIRGKS